MNTDEFKKILQEELHPIKEDIKSLKQDVGELKQDMNWVKKNLTDIIEQNEHIMTNMVSQKEFNELEERVTILEKN